MAIAGAMVAVAVLLFLWKYFVLKQRSKGTATSHVSPLLGTFLMIMFYLYIFLTKTSLDIFNCNPTTPDDHQHTYLAVVFVPCYVPGGMQMQLFPLAIIATAIYTAGFPGTLFYFLVKNRALIVEDQVPFRAPWNAG